MIICKKKSEEKILKKYGKKMYDKMTTLSIKANKS